MSQLCLYHVVDDGAILEVRNMFPYGYQRNPPCIIPEVSTIKRITFQQRGAMRSTANFLTLTTGNGLFVTGKATRIAPESDHEREIMLQIKIREWLDTGIYAASYKTSVGTVHGTFNLAEYAFSARGDWIYTGMFTIEQPAA